ncbi:bifunctional glycosyltransferase/CDP-glycerol:glycerophosphate glycerophosphotransferase [Demequina oxidasica]|uniref:bifunctional glycosyltransferase/CDP-glycerol:glycerophosphate glycerophosphotransferase n=1 Tax=Demequina oxidasica TaxID=676199 RepID=UPI0007856E23|nr:bifunctional glycosyltransferase family 2 protein/CDP-glycerol:glycerophosphate glycerophosphotransferase [Demequina oxidasica]
MHAPQFSVVIPAYNVQGYLRQAVMSVAQYESVEVIVVDDRSTDGTSVLADQLAAEYASVRVERPDSNVGLGRARNLGMREAQGEYIVFLDGDDYLKEGALERLRLTLNEYAADVVVFGYERLYPNGSAVEGVQRSPLQFEGPFVAADHTSILDVLNVAWNKVYRREFLDELGVEFPVGYYEDIPWSYPILAAANSIVGLDEPIYRYRQRWSGSILRSTDARHVQIVDQFDRLMDVMDGLGIEEKMRVEVFTRALRNIITLATTKRHRIPANMRRDFYTNARRSVRQHAPASYVLPTQGDKWKLMRRFWSLSYEPFALRMRASEALIATKTALRNGARSVVKFLRANYHNRRSYDFYRRFARVNSGMVVMENLWGRAPRLNCLAIDREIRRTHPGMRIVWSVGAADTPGVPSGWEYVVKGSHKYYRVLATAKYFFLDVNLPGFWKKRPRQVFTQLHHGTPLKRMGVEEVGQDRRWVNGLLGRCQNWDYSLVSNSYSAEVWKHSYPVNCETLEYGYPRNDVLVNADDSAVQAARERVGVGSDARVILYVPTFRERDRDLIPAADFDLIAEALDDGDVLLMRGHYLAGRERGAELHASMLDVTSYDAVEDLYLAADVMITDYSSAMFDFANLNRPIIVFAYDWEQYRIQRGTYFDITVDSPGIVARTASELAAALSSREYESPESAARLNRFQELFCEFDTGHAARDIVARVIEGAPARKIERSNVPSLATWQMDRVA